ncbi:hypothetical protein [Actinokineospora sp. NPDC004072]
MNEEVDASEQRIHVVLLEGHDGQVATPVGGCIPVSLADSRPLTDDQRRELLDASTILAAPLPTSVMDAVAALAVPALFLGDPWLNRHRVLLLQDRRCTVGGSVLRYDSAFGLYLDESE